MPAPRSARGPPSSNGPPVSTGSKAKAPSSKPASRRGEASVPPLSSKAPVSATKPNGKAPSSTRGKAATPVVPTEDVEMNGDAPNGEASNGHVKPSVNGAVATAEQKEINVPTKTAAPVKKGRVAELAAGGEESKKRRRSSVGVQLDNAIPQSPAPHRALFVFGTGDMGQFGLGPDELEEIGRPKLHSWFEEQIEDGRLSRDGKGGSGGLEAVACGGMHTLAIDEAGQVRSWGINDNAALGRKTTDVPDPANSGSLIPNEDLESYPYVVESLQKDGFRAVQVDAGDSISVALSDSGELRAWGSFRSNDGILGFDGVPGHSPFQFTPMSIPSLQKLKFVSVSCGADHVLALTTTGHVWVWGNGQQNQLGRRIIERRKIHGLHPERLGLRNIVLASTGTYHSFAVDINGTVWAWGLNTFHQTGISPDRGGDEEMITTPTQVDSLHPSQHDGARVVQIEGGEHHTIFLFDNGEVWGCGRADANQIGISKDHPAQEGLKERREEVVGQKQKKLEELQRKLEGAKDEDKEDAEREVQGAQANLSAAMDEFVPEPVRIFFPPIPKSYEVVPAFPSYQEAQTVKNPIAHISAGTRHNLAVSKSGHVYSWGLGMGAQLGLGNQESAEVPSLVRSKSLRPYTALYASAGGQHCVLLGKLGDPHAST